MAICSSSLRNSSDQFNKTFTSVFSLVLLHLLITRLGPGSAVGGKGKKRGQIGKISASEASPAVARGGGTGTTLSPPQTTSQLASFAVFFPFFANA